MQAGLSQNHGLESFITQMPFVTTGSEQSEPQWYGAQSHLLVGWQITSSPMPLALPRIRLRIALASLVVHKLVLTAPWQQRPPHLPSAADHTPWAEHRCAKLPATLALPAAATASELGRCIHAGNGESRPKYPEFFRIGYCRFALALIGPLCAGKFQGCEAGCAGYSRLAAGPVGLAPGRRGLPALVVWQQRRPPLRVHRRLLGLDCACPERVAKGGDAEEHRCEHAEAERPPRRQPEEVGVRGRVGHRRRAAVHRSFSLGDTECQFGRCE
eukprot:scaffold135471_cov31-Tisochrysis_lutea.AAC.1